MNLVNDIKDTLALKNPYEKKSMLEQLSDVFEYSHDLNEEDIVQGIQLLLAAALQEKEQLMKEHFFRVMNTAIIYQNVDDRVDWDTLADALSSLDKWQLEYALNVLGISGQERYLPILDEYTRNVDPEIREWAVDAIGEITYRLAHHADDQKGM